MALARTRFFKAVGVVAAFAAVSAGLWLVLNHRHANSMEKKLRVLSYASFINAWGPGPAIAQRFEFETGFKIEYIDAGDAGLLLKKLELFPADVVIGIDNLYVNEATAKTKWREPFVEYDWAPLGFIYRRGEIDPPQSIEELLSARFKNSISLEDPRTSTPGLHFLTWLIADRGEDAAFQFLQKLKPNIFAIAPGWSAAYGAFTKKHAKLVFSYLTSPIYHQIEEKDDLPQAAMFKQHPRQTELAGVPDNCRNCQTAHEFVRFLRSTAVQEIIMKKNYMLPSAHQEVAADTPFDKLLQVPEIKIDQTIISPHSRLDAILERWRKLEL